MNSLELVAIEPYVNGELRPHTAGNSPIYTISHIHILNSSSFLHSLLLWYHIFLNLKDICAVTPLQPPPPDHSSIILFFASICNATQNLHSLTSFLFLHPFNSLHSIIFWLLVTIIFQELFVISKRKMNNLK